MTTKYVVSLRDETGADEFDINIPEGKVLMVKIYHAEMGREMVDTGVEFIVERRADVQLKRKEG